MPDTNITGTLPDMADRTRRFHAACHGPYPLADCRDITCREVAAHYGPEPERDALEAHGCLHSAVVTWRGRRVIYPCRSHEDGYHHYAAHWPACPAPWYRLPASHALEGTMHDIPAGTVSYHAPDGTVSRG